MLLTSTVNDNSYHFNYYFIAELRIKSVNTLLFLITKKVFDIRMFKMMLI